MDNELLIRINANAKGFNDALDSARAKTEDLEQDLKSAAEVSGLAFAALAAEIGFAVHAYAEAEDSTRKLTQALQNQGLYSRGLVDDYKAQAKALEDLTGIDDDAIVAGQAQLQALIGRREITEDMTAAAVELGVALGGDVKSGFEALGRAMEGNVRILKQFNISIDENLSQEERSAAIIEAVNQKLGGQAAAANQGLGSLKGLKTAFGDLQEEIGAHFAPIIEAATLGLTHFFQYVNKHEGLTSLAAGILGAAAAMTGLVAALSVVGVGLLAAQAAAAAFGVTLAVALGPIGLAAAAITAVGAAVGIYIANTEKAGTPTEQLTKHSKDLREEMARLEAEINKPGAENNAGWLASLKSRLATLKADAADTDEKLRKLGSQANNGNGADGQSAKKKELAEKEEAERQDREQRRLDHLKAQNELIALESEHASKRTIDLAKEEADTLGKIADDKYKGERDALESHLDELHELQAAQDLVDAEADVTFHEQILEKNEEFQALTKEQQDRFLVENETQLKDQIQTIETTKAAAAQKALQTDIATNNTYLENQRKFGTSYAEIYKIMHSEVFQGTQKAFNEMAQFQQSSNSTLKAIGKAAAIANIVTKTAESAMNIYAGFSTIPFIGEVLGAAGAAAAVAFGGEQVAKVTAAQTGALVEGGIPGRDSVPFMLEPGELVVPRKNFEEVIRGVQYARAEAEAPSAAGAGPGGSVHVELSMRDQLVEFVEAKIIERRNLGISLIPQGAF